MEDLRWKNKDIDKNGIWIPDAGFWILDAGAACIFDSSDR
jgi:hypothetical protein